MSPINWTCFRNRTPAPNSLIYLFEIMELSDSEKCCTSFKMCDVNNLASQLLELSKQLMNSSKSFKLTLKTKDVNFTCSSQDRDLSSKEIRIKTISPSQKKRDFHRKKPFLKKKFKYPTFLQNYPRKRIQKVVSNQRKYSSVTNVTTRQAVK